MVGSQQALRDGRDSVNRMKEETKPVTYSQGLAKETGSARQCSQMLSELSQRNLQTVLGGVTKTV